MSEPLFGTDGIRGRAGVYPFDAATMTALGAVLVRLFRREGLTPRFLLGRDSRESSPAVEGWLAEGIAGEGGVVESAGLIPTPGVAYLTKQGGFGAGIMAICGALYEERIMDNLTGIFLNADMEFYKLAGIKDVGNIEVHLDITPENDARGVIGLGEPPVIPGMAAIANAVANAIGVRVPRLPLSPDKVLGALERRG